MVYEILFIIYNNMEREINMATNHDYFFNKNIANINKSISKILFALITVPVILLIGSLVNFFPYKISYIIFLLIFQILDALIHLYLTKKENTIFLTISKYFGMISITAFIYLLGSAKLVNLTISFAIAPFLSCLYYDKKFSQQIILIQYISTLIFHYVKSLTYFENITFVQHQISSLQWFIATMIGLTIEFVFLYIICTFMNKRTHETLTHIMEINTEKEEAIQLLREKNNLVNEQNKKIEDQNINMHQTQFKIIEFVSQCLGSHDLFTGQHVIHTKKYVEIICHKLRDDGFYTEELTDSNIDLFVTSAFLHDIGKIHIPEGVLNKPGKFTDEEFALMKCHPEEGKKLLEFLPKIDDGKFNEIAQQMAYCHHEKWDGTGYPQKLKEYDIPLCARIMAAADVLDALISKRLYKDPMTVSQAIDVFKKSSGSHFEPIIARAVINLEKEIEAIDLEFKTKESLSQQEEFNWWLNYHEKLNSNS
ncbi:MAG: HD domain-containing protein [Treponema sp.]|nr:HD domain-containing protein [Treponema sp.]